RHCADRKGVEMIMDKVNGYGMYHDYVGKGLKRNENLGKPEKTEKSDKSSETKQTELSDKAKELLKELQGKYDNMDFMVADYDSDEEARSYLSRGTKQYSVLIEPALLEKMADDNATKEKYIGLIDGATAKIDDIKEELGDDTGNVKNIGFSVKESGDISFFAELEKMSEKQTKKAFVKADFAGSLIEKIRQINWENIKESKAETQGSRFDYSI
ncbi:MAG: DUF6033 family protein, partial [Butyrivibrio sp.]|nr:DUF6033 family protein [Butyrivibrio sp.]